jgi:hypothetical protein
LKGTAPRLAEKLASFEWAQLHSLQKNPKHPPQHEDDGQVHPTVRSLLRCHPNINVNRFWVHPKVLSCTILGQKAQAQLSPSTLPGCSAFLQLSAARSFEGA